MASNNNIFCATNPARMADALWRVMGAGADDISRMLIFLPSRRAVRAVEKMIADRMGGAAILPRLVALGEGADDNPDDMDDAASDADVVSDIERVCVLTKLLSADASIGGYAAALPVARDLLRMTDYLENEGIDAATIDWANVIGEKYAAHFQAKARILNIIAQVMPAVAAGRMTRTQRRNADIRAWIPRVESNEFSRVIVCASTASVPATADLMAAVAGSPHGRIILSGRIAGRAQDFELPTNPYNSEYKFLSRIGVAPADVQPIDVGASDIDFFNRAFGNVISGASNDLPHCHLVETNREAEEAAAIAEIAARALGQGQSVLVITPDAAANQRIAAEFSARNLIADFSGGLSGASSPAGRAILNLFDDWIERGDAKPFDTLFARFGNLFDVIAYLVDARGDNFAPAFDAEAFAPIWIALHELSDALSAAEIVPNIHDARAFVADCLAGVSLRPAMNDAAQICVLGTIESRMQTADVVILSGLNDGMFPARGYENAWLPRVVADRIGLPPADRKVSLMSLDFMNLSCGAEVYWTRSRMSGGMQTMASRFLSRVAAHGGAYDMAAADDILRAVRARDIVAARPLNSGVACPPADWSDVYVTELELLIHNPYAFYAKHILRLRPLDDYWIGPDARDFGNLVHETLEKATDWTPDVLVAQMDARAQEKLGAKSVLFHFWHRRFLEIAPVVARVLGNAQHKVEIAGAVQIPVGGSSRTVRARADRVWDAGVMDIKTGAAPSKKQLLDGNMPQLPLEAYMLQSGGFHGMRCVAPVMSFLQLKSGDVREIQYDAATTQSMIDAAVEKVQGLFNQYTAGGAEYEYRKTNDKKYQAWDDLARVDD